MADPLRICIVTPGQLGSNPRVVKEADALVGAGHAVTVVCARVAGFVEPRDQAVIARARFAVRRVAFDRPFAWRAARLRQELARALCRVGFKQHFSEEALSAMVPGLVRAALEVPANLYIAHYPPALPAAARAAERRGARFAFDAEDFHLGDLPDHVKHAFDKELIRAVESRYLPHAAHVTAASPMIADAYAATYGIKRPLTLLNVFPRGNAPSAPSPRGSHMPGPTLYWFSQVIGPGRGLEMALRAISLTRASVCLHLRGTPARGFADTLMRLADELGVAEQLHIIDPVEPDALERDGAQFDLGYVGEVDETCNRQIALTNKLFSYLTSGLPILASDIPAHRLIAQDLGKAAVLFPLDDPAALAAEIDRFCAEPERLAAARHHAWHLGQGRFGWEAEQERLVALVSEPLRQPGST